MDCWRQKSRHAGSSDIGGMHHNDSTICYKNEGGDVEAGGHSFIDLATMCNGCDHDQLGCVLDDVQHPPITYPKAPLIFVAFQLFASRETRVVGERQNLTIYPGEQRIVERIQFPLRRLLDFERVLNHAGGYASGGLPGIARMEWPFLCAAIQTPDRPRSPPIPPRVFSGR